MSNSSRGAHPRFRRIHLPHLASGGYVEEARSLRSRARCPTMVAPPSSPNHACGAYRSYRYRHSGIISHVISYLPYSGSFHTGYSPSTPKSVLSPLPGHCGYYALRCRLYAYPLSPAYPFDSLARCHLGLLLRHGYLPRYPAIHCRPSSGRTFPPGILYPPGYDGSVRARPHPQRQYQ